MLKWHEDKNSRECVAVCAPSAGIKISIFLEDKELPEKLYPSQRESEDAYFWEIYFFGKKDDLLYHICSLDIDTHPEFCPLNQCKTRAEVFYTSKLEEFIQIEIANAQRIVKSCAKALKVLKVSENNIEVE